MNIRRWLFWLAWVIIAIAAILTIILNLGRIEFADAGALSTFQSVRAIGVAASVALLFLVWIRVSDPGAAIAGKLLAALVLPVLVLFLLGLVGFASGMCVWSEHKTLFVYRADPGRRIVLRDLGCGATDSGPPVFRVFEMKSVAGVFNYVDRVDTTGIDRTQWRPVEPAQ